MTLQIVRSFQDGWVREWDSEHMAPYAYSTREKQWVGYDDMESIYHKVMSNCTTQWKVLYEKRNFLSTFKH